MHAPAVSMHVDKTGVCWKSLVAGAPGGGGRGLVPGGQGDNRCSDGKRWEGVDVGACGITVIDDIYPTRTICCTVINNPMRWALPLSS